MSEPNNEEPKILVDDDWKAQVEREKEQLKNQDPNDANAEPQLPPASFSLLVQTLSTQSMATLGFLPDPMTGEAQTNRPMAKHFIDTLAVIEEKTAGNLSEDEETLLRETLHHLRMAYVASGKQAEADAAPESKIELP